MCVCMCVCVYVCVRVCVCVCLCEAPCVHVHVGSVRCGDSMLHIGRPSLTEHQETVADCSVEKDQEILGVYIHISLINQPVFSFPTMRNK